MKTLVVPRGTHKGSQREVVSHGMPGGVSRDVLVSQGCPQSNSSSVPPCPCSWTRTWPCLSIPLSMA